MLTVWRGLWFLLATEMWDCLMNALHMVCTYCMYYLILLPLPYCHHFEFQPTLKLISSVNSYSNIKCINAVTKVSHDIRTLTCIWLPQSVVYIVCIHTYLLYNKHYIYHVSQRTLFHTKRILKLLQNDFCCKVGVIYILHRGVYTNLQHNRSQKTGCLVAIY